MRPSPAGAGRSRRKELLARCGDALLPGLDPFFNCIQTKVRNSERCLAPREHRRERGCTGRKERTKDEPGPTWTGEMMHGWRRQTANSLVRVSSAFEGWKETAECKICRSRSRSSASGSFPFSFSLSLSFLASSQFHHLATLPPFPPLFVLA